MSKHLGDYDTSAVVYGKFTTFRPSTGAAYTLGGTPALSVYKDNSTTQTTTGVTLTVDFDTVTGLNHFAIDTSADGTFYAAGSFFDIVITTGTVDSVSVVGTVVASFTLRKDSALKPTVAGRTFDVTATGEGGLDFANINQASSPTTLTNVTVPNVTTTTTATNLTNERGKYANGAVWIGPAANTNTVSYTDGIITNPVSTIAAAKTIADALGIRRFYTTRTGTVSIGAAMTGYDFDGANWSLTTTGGSQDVGTSHIHHANLAGGTFASTTGVIHWEYCDFDVAVTVGVSHMAHCVFGNTLTLSTAGDYDFVDCASVVAGASAPTFVIPAGTVNISFRRWSGGITISGVTSGTTVSIDVVSGGTVTINGADGNVQVRGMCSGITDNRTGSPTLGQNATLNRTVLATPTNITAGTITTATNVTTVNGLAANVITAASIATGAIDADAVAADAVDEFWAKTLAELSAVPGATASVLDALNWIFTLARNKMEQTSTVSTLRKDDGTTSLATSTVSDDGTTFTRGEWG